MEEYRDLEQDSAARITSYSNKCISRLKHLSSLSTYHTTTRAQFHVYQSVGKKAEIIKDSCDTLQQVIDTYSKQVNEMYPKERFSTTRKHRRSDEMKRLFKRARLPLQKVLDTLDKLRAKEKKILDVIQNGTVEFQNLNLDSTTNDKQNKLQEIQEDIAIAEEKRKKKEAIYIEKATAIFKQCQQLEKERLEQIKQTLIDFIQAVHPSRYSNAFITIYESLLSDIKTQQNSIEDLNYWAQTYGVHTLVSTTLSETNESNYDSASDDDQDDHQ